jgi:transposase InsO family protein
VSHRRARLTQYGRALLVHRVLEEGWSPSAAAEAAGVARATVYKWVHRFEAEGPEGLRDRSSRPHRIPRQVAPSIEQRVLGLRRSRKLGPHRLSGVLGVPRSTCYSILRRNGMHRLAWMDRPTGEPIRRYERERPGELVHVDVKKLARIPDGGGHRALGRAHAPHSHGKGLGYDYVHAAVDDHSRLAYAEIHPDERAPTCAGFMHRAGKFFASHGISIDEVMTDNAWAYRHGRAFRDVLAELEAAQVFIRPYRPQTNGKAERFNRTLLEEWASVRAYRSNSHRAALLDRWLHMYNHHRSHTALGGRSPIERVDNLCGNYS